MNYAESHSYRRLYGAILVTAIYDVTYYLKRTNYIEGDTIDINAIKGKYIREAFTYIWSDDVYPCSFIWICDFLELNPEVIRKDIFNYE